jgi:putative endonuclease
MTKGGTTYILTNRPGGALYIGVTSNLIRRIYEHRSGIGSAFTGSYDITRLVWFEQYDEIVAAITREKQLKAWRRAWKIALIREHNPKWDDLYPLISR